MPGIPVAKDAMPPIAAFPKSKPLPIPLDTFDLRVSIPSLNGVNGVLAF